MLNLDLSEKIGKIIIKTNFIAFLQISCFILGQNCDKGRRVMKIVKQIKFEWIWGKVETVNKDNHPKNI